MIPRMEPPFTEIEVKLRFDTPETAVRALERLGAALSKPRHFEENVLFDREREPLKDTERMVRLRRVDRTAKLTFKAPVPGEHRHKVRIEHETGIEDAEAMERILAGLDLAPSYRYQKYRTVYDLESLQACLDETPLGTFLELEGRPEIIDRVAERLGFSPEQYIRDSYRDLHEAHARDLGEEPGDLVFAAAGDGL